jgi:hypothetical protein
MTAEDQRMDLLVAQLKWDRMAKKAAEYGLSHRALMPRPGSAPRAAPAPAVTAATNPAGTNAVRFIVPGPTDAEIDAALDAEVARQKRHAAARGWVAPKAAAPVPRATASGRPRLTARQKEILAESERLLTRDPVDEMVGEIRRNAQELARYAGKR